MDENIEELSGNRTCSLVYFSYSSLWSLDGEEENRCDLGVKSLYHAHSASKLLPILGLSLCVSLIMLVAGTTEIGGVAMISTIVALKYLSCKAFKPEFLRRRENPVAALIIAAAGVLNY